MFEKILPASEFEALATLCLSALIVAYSLWREASRWSLQAWALVLACSGLTVLSGQWDQENDVLSLHLMPAFFVSMSFLLYWGHRFTWTFAYACTFVSAGLADVLAAGWVFRQNVYQGSWDFLHGIGGAGLHDGLFFFPCAAAFVSRYAAMRRGGGRPSASTTSLV